MGRLTLYGNVRILRAMCPDCSEMSLVVDGRHQCCGRTCGDTATRMHRMCEPLLVRRRPSVETQRKILSDQMNCCYYCGNRFGLTVYRGGRARTLSVVWDHEIPWVYSQDNGDSNFVAACAICNGIKRDRCFAGPDEARAHIADRWQQKGYAFTRPPIVLHRGYEVSCPEDEEEVTTRAVDPGENYEFKN